MTYLVQAEAGHQVVFLVRREEHVLHHPQSDVPHQLAGLDRMVLIVTFLLLHHSLEDLLTGFILNRKYFKSKYNYNLLSTFISTRWSTITSRSCGSLSERPETLITTPDSWT